MSLIDNRIHLLDNISQAKIKSAVQILSLTDVIVELVKNALDAQASSIKIVLNYAHGFCSVLDNGYGIPAGEFSQNGRLARAYCTSKTERQANIYGHHGRFLAALSGLSLLSITSRTANEHSAHVLWLDDSGRLGHTEELPDSTEIKRGTLVKVHNLFSKLPVRWKHLADRFATEIVVQKEFDRLKHVLTGLTLAFPRSFELHVQHSGSTCNFHHKSASTQTTRMMKPDSSRTVDAVISALHHAGYVDRSHGKNWRQSTISSGGIRIHAVISLDPMPHKLVQFMAVNHQPLAKQTHPEQFNIVNTLFDGSNFAVVDLENDNGSMQMQNVRQSGPRQRQDQAKGVDRWPMFVIWINTDVDATNGYLHAIGLDHQTEKLMARITSLIGTLITEFLITHGFHRGKSEKHQAQPRHSVPSGIDAPLSPLDASQSKQNFRYWSRVKSSRLSVMDNILRGLPFQTSKCHKEDILLGLGPKIHPMSSDSDTTHVPDEPQDFLAGTEKATYRSEAVIEWTDPQTGRTLHIDKRTGMVSPDAIHLPTISTSAGARTLPGQRNHALPQSRRKKNRDLPLEKVAQNIRRYSSGWSSNQNLPVRSITLFDDHDESLEERAQTRKKQVDKFWQSTGHCQAHSGAPTAQLEMPRISKKALAHARILQQVDNKFILALTSDPNCHTKSSGKLVLIDQHAADERCKVEDLLRSLHADQPVTLASSLRFEVGVTEAQMLDVTKLRFAQWNIVYDVTFNVSGQKLPVESVTTRTQHEVRVTALPAAIAERCRLNPKLIIELLREEIWSDNPGLRNKSNSSLGHDKDAGTFILGKGAVDKCPTLTTARLPPRLLDLINSRACRSAIMFNDELTMDQCEKLVAQLSNCTLPFQCAHGRPSMVVLSDLDSFLDHNPLASDSTAKTLALTSPIPNQRLPPALIRSVSATLQLRSQTKGGESMEGRSVGPTLDATASSTANARRYSALNTIDDRTDSFGQAYRAWNESDTIPVQTATLS